MCYCVFGDSLFAAPPVGEVVKKATYREKQKVWRQTASGGNTGGTGCFPPHYPGQSRNNTEKIEEEAHRMTNVPGWI